MAELEQLVEQRGRPQVRIVLEALSAVLTPPTRSNGSSSLQLVARIPDPPKTLLRFFPVPGISEIF